MKRLHTSLENAVVIMKGQYPYFIHPLTDGIPPIDPALLRDAAAEIIKIIDIDSFNKILTVESMGMPIGVALSMLLDKPISIVRKRAYGLPGEIVVSQKTGYSSGMLYINYIGKDDRLLLVDDVLSTGGTMTAIVNGLKTTGAKITDIVVIVNKNRNIETIEGKIGMRIKTVVNIEIVEGKVRILD